MPPKKLLSERERGICARVRELRLSTKLSRAAFARELGLGASRLKNYERGDVPLPYAVADKICSAFNVNQEWLAERRGPAAGYRHLSHASFSPRELFSSVYDRLTSFLMGGIAPQLKSAGVQVVVERTPGSMASTPARAGLVKTFQTVMEELPNHLVWPYYHHLLAASDQFREEQNKVNKTQNKTLHPAGTSLKKDTMKIRTLPELLDALRKKTAKRGMKSKLAADLGVPLASVSLWLSGEREPGGAVTFELLKWVEQFGR